MRIMEWIAYATGKAVDRLEAITAKARAELAVDKLNYYERQEELQRNLEAVLELQQETEDQLISTQTQLDNEQERCERQARALSIAQQGSTGWRESFTVANTELIELRAKGRNSEMSYQAMCEALDSRKWWVVTPPPKSTPFMAYIFSSEATAVSAHPGAVPIPAKLVG